MCVCKKSAVICRWWWFILKSLYFSFTPFLFLFLNFSTSVFGRPNNNYYNFHSYLPLPLSAQIRPPSSLLCVSKIQSSVLLKTFSFLNYSVFLSIYFPILIFHPPSPPFTYKICIMISDAVTIQILMCRTEREKAVFIIEGSSSVVK